MKTDVAGILQGWKQELQESQGMEYVNVRTPEVISTLKISMQASKC